MPRNKRGRDSERLAHRDEEWPRLPQLEKALAQKRRPNTAKNKLKKKKNAGLTPREFHYKKKKKKKKKETQSPCHQAIHPPDIMKNDIAFI